jgi:hypothetical protein
MESEINKQIRQILEDYGINPLTKKTSNEVLSFNILGALSNCLWDNRKEHYSRVLSMVNSHGFMEYLMGNMTYQEIKKPTIPEECSHEWREVEGNGDWNEQCMTCKALRTWKFQK